MNNPTSQKAKELAARLREWVSVGATKRWPTRSMDDDMLAVIEYLESPDGPESDGWNAGIEAAAKLVDERHDPCEPWLTGDEVRALKRPEAGADDDLQAELVRLKQWFEDRRDRPGCTAQAIHIGMALDAHAKRSATSEGSK